MKYRICLFYLPIWPCFYAYFRAYSTLFLCHFWPSLVMKQREHLFIFASISLGQEDFKFCLSCHTDSEQLQSVPRGQTEQTCEHYECPATMKLQLEILQNKIPLPDMTWSILRLLLVMQHPTIEDLLNPFNVIPGIDIIYQDHNHSLSSDSSL